MADYYTQFSVEVPLPVNDTVGQFARDWFKNEEEQYEEFDDANPFYGFNYSIDDGGVWIWSDESGDVNSTINVIQKYLKDHSIDGGIYFSWANTCSKPRVDSFSGGECVITGSEVIYPESVLDVINGNGIKIINH